MLRSGGKSVVINLFCSLIVWTKKQKPLRITWFIFYPLEQGLRQSRPTTKIIIISMFIFYQLEQGLRPLYAPSMHCSTLCLSFSDYSQRSPLISAGQTLWPLRGRPHQPKASPGRTNVFEAPVPVAALHCIPHIGPCCSSPRVTDTTHSNSARPRNSLSGAPRRLSLNQIVVFNYLLHSTFSATTVFSGIKIRCFPVDFSGWRQRDSASFSQKGYKLKCIMRWEVSHITDTRRKMKNACPQHVVYFEIIYKFAKTEWHGQQPSFWNIQTETGSQKMMNSRTAKQWCLSSTALD